MLQLWLLLSLISLKIKKKDTIFISYMDMDIFLVYY